MTHTKDKKQFQMNCKLPGESNAENMRICGENNMEKQKRKEKKKQKVRLEKRDTMRIPRLSQKKKLPVIKTVNSIEPLMYEAEAQCCPAILPSASLQPHRSSHASCPPAVRSI
jgi:hypothetical protein